MKPIIIGLAGEKGAGKESVVNVLRMILGRVDHIRSSDVLIESAMSFGYKKNEISRAQLQEWAKQADKIFGKGSITKGVKKRLVESNLQIRIFDGIRWHTDVEMLRSLSNSFLIYVTADMEIRWKRSQKRKEKAGEDKATLEQFAEEEKAATEIYIKEIGRRADFTINNNGSPKKLEEQVRLFVSSKIKANS
ncbi:AAA family ATPase [Candidatus Wolfebacteria bacterium]|nr:AAA family ATPase [Candidatus Wolfebacteria bacterium]